MNIAWGPCRRCKLVMVPPAEEGGDGFCQSCRGRDHCMLCPTGVASVLVPAPLMTRDTRFPGVVCPECWESLQVMLLDLPWLRYQISQYRRVPPGTKNYNPEGMYFGP